MRLIQFAPGEYYHLLGRGNNKQTIVLDDRDCARFLFTLIYFQGADPVRKIGPRVSAFLKSGTFKVSEKNVGDILKKRHVELVNFAIMENHYHLTVQEVKDGGITAYMQRTLNSYTKYFNERHNRVGHLFQGPFKAVHVESDNQLAYLSAYIHRNPRELARWRGKEDKYPWSSYQDYVGGNRWGALLETDSILYKFKDENDYRAFVSASGAKLDPDEYET